MSKDKRKHITQMIKSEITFLVNRIGDLSLYHLTDYAYTRKDTRNIFDDCINKSFKSYDIIEYHVMSGTPRVLVRGNNNGVQVCMVVCPMTKKIITMYYNSSSDQHDTIDMSQYDKRINVFDTYRHYHTIPDVTPLVEFVPPIPEKKEEKPYHTRTWLNKEGQYASSTITCFAGQKQYYDKILSIHDCHNVIRIHQLTAQTDAEYLEKIRIIERACKEFGDYLEERLK